MPKVTDTPEFLRPYLAHGLDLTIVDGKNAVGDCPFCNGTNSFGVKLADGVAQCWKCTANPEAKSAKGGVNGDTFLERLWEVSITDISQLTELAANRKVSAATLAKWGVRLSKVSREVIVPGHTPEGKFTQLYRYSPPQGKTKPVLKATPGVHHQLAGVPLYDADKPIVYLCEGVWDAMALWEVLGQAEKVGENLLVTGKAGASLLAQSSVLGVPGCKVFAPEWAKLCAGKIAVMLYDNDKAGYEGMKRVAGVLTSSGTPPAEVHYLAWGEGGPDLKLPTGYDVRDWLNKVGNKLDQRVLSLQELLAKIKPVPEEWHRKPEPKHMGCLPCAAWDELIDSWRKALRWTEGLDRAFSVMLAAVTSTKAVGDQLWIKVVSPPSCLDGDTLVHDPIDGSAKTVRDRWERGEEFSVYTRRGDSLGITRAKPPHKYPAAGMYEVEFASGRKLRVTDGHRIWDGTSYLSLLDLLQRSAACRLPTISGTDFLARLRDARRLRQTAPS